LTAVQDPPAVILGSINTNKYTYRDSKSSAKCKDAQRNSQNCSLDFKSNSIGSEKSILSDCEYRNHLNWIGAKYANNKSASNNLGEYLV
jgi:hypothetical protein